MEWVKGISSEIGSEMARQRLPGLLWGGFGEDQGIQGTGVGRRGGQCFIFGALYPSKSGRSHKHIVKHPALFDLPVHLHHHHHQKRAHPAGVPGSTERDLRPIYGCIAAQHTCIFWVSSSRSRSSSAQGLPRASSPPQRGSRRP